MCGRLGHRESCLDYMSGMVCCLWQLVVHFVQVCGRLGHMDNFQASTYKGIHLLLPVVPLALEDDH